MALVQCVANDNAGGATTLTVALSATSAGNLVGCAFFFNGTISTVIDNLAQSYTPTIAVTEGGGGSNQSALYYFPNSAAGVTLITVTFTGSVPGIIFGFEESGVAASSPVDSTPVGQGQSIAGWTSTAMATTSSANDVLYGFAGGGTSNADTCAAGTGWTAVTGTGITSGTRGNTVDHSIGFLERRAVSATGAYDASGTWGSVQKTASLIVAFKPSSAPGTPQITGVSNVSPSNGSSLTITGLIFGGLQGAGSVSLGGTAQTVTSWSATSIVITVARGVNQYGVALNIVVTDNSSVASNAFPITSIIPQAGWSYIDLTTQNADSTKRLTASAVLVSGDQIAYDNKSGLVTVLPDGTFYSTVTVPSFNCEGWTGGAGGGWGATALQTINSGVAPPDPSPAPNPPPVVLQPVGRWNKVL